MHNQCARVQKCEFFSNCFYRLKRELEDEKQATDEEIDTGK